VTIGGVELRKDEVWRAALTLNGLFILSQVFGFISYRTPPASPLGLTRLLEIAWCVTLVSLLLVRRRTGSTLFNLACYGLACLPHFVLFWIRGASREAAGHSWEPFWRQRVLCLMLAMISPGELVITGAVIVAVAVEACIEFWVTDLRYSPHLAHGEPWVTVAIAAIGLWMLIYRTRVMARERRHEAKLREALAVERLARVSVAVRDLANSPLQLLLIGLGLLSRTVPDEEPVLERMRRAVDRLHELNDLLAPLVREVGWRPEWASLDSTRILEEELQPPAPH
jgi:hypothetical protein